MGKFEGPVEYRVRRSQCPESAPPSARLTTLAGAGVDTVEKGARPVSIRTTPVRRQSRKARPVPEGYPVKYMLIMRATAEAVEAHGLREDHHRDG